MIGLGWRLERILHPVAATPPVPDPAQVATLAARLEAAGRRMRTRPTRLLHVGTGGCGACRLEVAALDGPVADLERAGLSLVGSPVAADILLVTGPGARNAAPVLRRAWEAMPGSRYVVSVGDCAAGAGFGGDYAVLADGIGAVVAGRSGGQGSAAAARRDPAGGADVCEAAVR